MAISPGTRIGPYEVLSVLGAGGMGEVFRARDTKLNRDVALKVLRPDVDGHADRTARFRREAQTLAALNHPHIAAIYGFEEAGGISALVLELVEGQTLADRIAAGRPPLGDALAIARQIAEALEAAHEKGILHRDLKPANVSITPDGRVKVLDFGLAKVLDSAEHGDSTVTAFRTGSGVVMGTPAYMSPEQARGDAVGRQTDIWAFGGVLYELLTGVSAFGRHEHRRDAGAGVERPTRLRPPTGRDAGGGRSAAAPVPREGSETPAAAHRRRAHRARGRRVERRAIDRGASVGDRPWAWIQVARHRGAAARRDGGICRLEAGARRGRRFGTVTDPSHPVVRGIGGRPHPHSASAISRSRAMARPWPTRETIGCGFAGWIAKTRSRLAAGRTHSSLPTDRQWDPSVKTTDSSEFRSPAERRCASPGTRDGPRAQPGPRMERSCSRPARACFRVPAEGGEPKLLKAPDRERNETLYAWPELLPGGQMVMFTIVRDTQPRTEIATLDLATGEVRPAWTSGSFAKRASDGRFVFAAGTTLRAVNFDLGSRQASAPVAIPDVEVAYTGDNGAADFALSATGTLVFIAPGGARGNCWSGSTRRAAASLWRWPPAATSIPGFPLTGHALRSTWAAAANVTSGFSISPAWRSRA